MQNQLTEKRSQYPEFLKTVEMVSRQNPLQAKRIQAFINAQGKEYWSFAEDIASVLNRNVLTDEKKRQDAAEAYNALCLDMLRFQIQFRKTGRYPASDAEKANKEVYSNPDVMHKYMLGLLMTQMLWPNHYALFCFFQSALKENSPRRYLEVGAGHGLFAADVLRTFPDAHITICDLSRTSLDMTKKLLKAFAPDISNVEFIEGDFLKSSFQNKRFDFICLGEVLEHVHAADKFLLRAQELLEANGKMYLSTCANCPAVDHVYHFRSVDEIRTLLRKYFTVKGEIFLPAEDVPEESWQEKLVTINYAALLKSKKTIKHA